MPTPRFTRPLSELRHYLGQVAARLRSRRQYAPLLDIEVAQDIAADVFATQQTVLQLAHSAEVHDLEALSAIERAQAPESPGGVAITRTETKGIIALIRRAVGCSQQISETLG